MTWPPLSPGEVLLPDPDPDELIMRALGPHVVDAGAISPEAFALSTTEQASGKLSCARAAKQTASGLRAERERRHPASVVMVCGLTVAEVEASGELRVIDDSALVAEATGHSYTDFRLVQKTAREHRRLVRQRLADAAEARGPLAS